MSLDTLPEDCFAQVLAFTSAQDACRSSLVSSSMHSMADSDAVWEKFLPSDWKDILSRLDSPVAYSSKKELFCRLCSPQLLDEGKKVFFIDKFTGKKCCILSAGELCIRWAANPLYWSWKPHPDSRFAEAAELRTVWWLEILGVVNTKTLSPRTVYGAYLLVKFADRAYGLDTLPSEVSVEVNSFKSQGTVYLRPRERGWQLPRDSKDEEEGRVREREDGWVEIELGRFYSGGGDHGDVKMWLKEVKGQHLRGGLIVEGIELRPMMC